MENKTGGRLNMKNKPRTTLKDQVYVQLFTDIINGVYSADAVLTEKFLMEKYQMSRAPIREALLQLTGKNFLVSIPRQGYRIMCPDKKLIMELQRYRAIMEPAFLERSVYRIKAEDLRELREICDQYAGCPADDYMTKWRHNCKFHLKIFSLNENMYAYEILKNILYVETIYFVQAKVFSTMDLHLAVVDYLEKKDIPMAIKLLEADIDHLITKG